jgi:predicted nucleotide-binding protein (sugar kinase/HSP70/actin superfamily)
MGNRKQQGPFMPVVNQFDVDEAEKELKNCPLIVKQYVKLLKENVDRWKEVNRKAIREIFVLSKQQNNDTNPK